MNVRKVAGRGGLMIASAVAVSLALASPAFAQSGHFIERTVECVDVGTQVECVGKVAGLGGVTFGINVKASGVAIVECTNAGGNVAPGQTFETLVGGATGPLPTPQNGHYGFSIVPEVQAAPVDSCPNDLWSAAVVDVEFSEATVTLVEDSTETDSVVIVVTS